jgi:hypothetical protein
MIVNLAAEYVGSSGTESCCRVTGKLCMYDVESCCRVTGKQFMMLNHAAEYVGSSGTYNHTTEYLGSYL